MTVAVTREPFRLSKMTLESLASAIGLDDGIDMENEAGHLPPVRIVGLSVQKRRYVTTCCSS